MTTEIIVYPGSCSEEQHEILFREIKRVLSDPQSWGLKFKFQKKKKELTKNISKNMIQVYGKTSNEIDHLFPNFSQSGKGLSVTNIKTKKVYFNRDRFFTLFSESGFPSLSEYREYLINHEIGHALGLKHPSKEYAKSNGVPSPVMQQQTLGEHLLWGYISNSWPTYEERRKFNITFRQTLDS